MMLLTYTSYDQIRAVLGVSETELPDRVLALPMYDIMPSLFLEDVNANIETKFSEVSALPSLTTGQERFLDLVKLYATYRLSKELLVSMPMFSVKQLSDGRAEFQRANDAFQDVRDGVDAAVTSLRYRLAAVFSTLYPTEVITTTFTTASMVRSTRLATDPVTNAQPV